MPRKPPPSILGVQTRRLLAQDHAHGVAPRIRTLMGEGLTLRQIAETLEAEGVKTARGGRWRAENVRRALEIAGAAASPPDEPNQPAPSVVARPSRTRLI